MDISLPALIFVSMTSDVGWERLVLGAAAPILGLGLVLLMMASAVLLAKLISVPEGRRGYHGTVLCAQFGLYRFPGCPLGLWPRGVNIRRVIRCWGDNSPLHCGNSRLQNGTGAKGSWRALINPCLAAVLPGLPAQCGRCQRT